MENAHEKKRLGLAVKTAREKQGISQRSFALMTGTSRSYLWKIESGSADIGIDVLCKIARALGVKVSDLIDFRPSSHYSSPAVFVAIRPLTSAR